MYNVCSYFLKRLKQIKLRAASVSLLGMEQAKKGTNALIQFVTACIPQWTVISSSIPIITTTIDVKGINLIII